MINSRAGEFSELHGLLRRVAFLRHIDGDKRDAEIVINDFLELLEVRSLRPQIETLRGIVRRLALKVGAIEDPKASEL